MRNTPRLELLVKEHLVPLFSVKEMILEIMLLLRTLI
jgi:hypothetical protein